MATLMARSLASSAIRLDPPRTPRRAELGRAVPSTDETTMGTKVSVARMLARSGASPQRPEAALEERRRGTKAASRKQETNTARNGAQPSRTTIGLSATKCREAMGRARQPATNNRPDQGFAALLRTKHSAIGNKLHADWISASRCTLQHAQQ
jgi:hypothetical protein